MANILRDAAYMALPMNIKRGNPIPLDTTAVWYSKTELQDYATSGATSYVGQILTLIENGACEAYLIADTSGTLTKLAHTTASGDLASDVATLQGQVNTLIAKVGSEAAEGVEATGLYKLIADVKAIADKGVADAATAKSAADGAQADVDALEEVVGTDDTKGLRKKVADNTAAITTLNGTGAGSVDKKVTDAINAFANKVTENGTIDTFKELVDWVAAHPDIVDGLTGDITKLNAIVDGIGGEGEKATVVEYVTDAIAALSIGDYAKAADLTNAISRIATLEGKPAVDITAEQIASWNGKVDQSAYDTQIEALNTADSSNAAAAAEAKNIAEAAQRTANAAVPKNPSATAGTGIKVTTDANGIVIGYAALEKTDIPTIEQDQVNGLGTALAGKQDNITFNTGYDASTNKAATMSDVNTAKNAVVGSADDASTIDTIGGAKKYAEEKAAAALSASKSYTDGILSGDTGLVQRVTTLEGKVDVAKVSTAIATAKSEAISEATTAAANDASAKDKTLKSAILGKADNGSDFDGTVKGAYEAAAAASRLAGEKTTMAEVEAKGYAVKSETDVAIADAKKAGTDAASALNAYKTSNDTRVKAIEDKEAGWDAKQNAITDGSATIAQIADGIVTIKAGVAQDAGAIKQGTGADITLAKVASTGAAADISIADADDKLTATTVEGALAELATAVGGKAITCEKTNPDGVAARYVFKQGGVEITNAVIDIPKDMVVSSGSVVTNPDGQEAGTYLELVLANATNDKVYINVGNLIEYVVSGSTDTDSVQVAVSSDHKVTASIKDGSIVLGKLASSVQSEINKAHTHSNKAALDTVTSEKIANWDDAVTKAHTHSNKTVLDSITQEKVAAWDAANSSIDAAVDAGIATLDYTDTAVAGKYVSAVSQKDGVISVTRVALPTATAVALGMVKPDDKTLEVVDGTIKVKQVNVSALYVASGDSLILNGGSSTV